MQLFGPNNFRKITGEVAPPTPITAELYAKRGYPFFELYEEQSGIAADSLDDILKSYGEMEREDDVEGREDGSKEEEQGIYFRVVKLHYIDEASVFNLQGGK